MYDSPYGCNLPQMASYLATHFPQIPAEWRMPIIVATFTAVQKASAVHGDILVCDDPESPVVKAVIGAMGSWS